jgi:sugar lactone lactonase YvrE
VNRLKIRVVLGGDMFNLRIGRVAAVALLLLTTWGCTTSSDSVREVRTVTIAGTGEPGAADGAIAVARFNNPVNVAVDGAGNTYVADFYNGRVRKIDANGNVTTVVNQANFSRPFGITISKTGELFVQTDENDTGQRDGTTGTIWRVDLTTNVATVVARNLGRPRGLLALADGRLVLADIVHHTLRFMNTTSGAVVALAGVNDSAGFVDGVGANARFNRPYGMAQATNGDILVAEGNNHTIRRVTLAGVVSTVAGGGGVSGYLDAQGASARFNTPQDVAVDLRGNLYVTDCGNHRIRKIDPLGNVTTIAGDGTAGFKDGVALDMQFFGQEGIDISFDGSTLIIADGTGGSDVLVAFHRIRRLTLP